MRPSLHRCRQVVNDRASESRSDFEAPADNTDLPVDPLDPAEPV